MSTLTTNDIRNVGQLQEKNQFAANDALLAWDAAGQKHVKLTYQKLNQAYSTIQSACESAAGTAGNKANEAHNWANGYSGGTYATNNAEYFKTQAAAEALKSEGWAEGTENGTDVPSTSPYHEHNSKYWAAQAGTSAGSAGSDALKAEGWAVGKQNGQNPPSGSPYINNNAAYYAGQAGTSESNALSYKNAAEAAASAASAYASIILIASGTVGQQKTVTLPSGYEVERQALKVVFPVGHAMSTDTAMTLNGTVVVANKNGTLTPLARHQLTAGTYSVLQANTVLDLYYTADYDGNSTPAWVVIGNPVVLSSAAYTIFADGLKRVDTIQDGNMGMVTSNAVWNNSVKYKDINLGVINANTWYSYDTNNDNDLVNAEILGLFFCYLGVNEFGTAQLTYNKNTKLIWYGATLHSNGNIIRVVYR